MSENFEVNDKSSLHRYRTELPNIIFTLGLDPYEFSLYCVLKKTAGDLGKCTKSMKTLSEEVGCGITKLKEIKKTLSNPREKLKGLALINVFARVKPNGDCETDLIEIIDIWPINFELYGIKENNKGTSPKNPPVRRYATPLHTPNDPKEEPIEEDPKKEERKETSSSSFSDQEIQMQKTLLEKGLNEASIISILAQKPTPESLKTALDCAEAYNPDELGSYLCQAIKMKWQPPKKIVPEKDKEKEILERKEKLVFENRGLFLQMRTKFWEVARVAGVYLEDKVNLCCIGDNKISYENEKFKETLERTLNKILLI